MKYSPVDNLQHHSESLSNHIDSLGMGEKEMVVGGKRRI